MMKFIRSQISYNTNWLFFFRTSVAVFCLIHFVALWPDLKNILTDNSYILPDIVDAKSSHVIPTIFSLNNVLNKYFHVSYNLYVFSAIYSISLLLLALGLFSRFSAIIAAFCHAIFLSSINFFSYGVDYFCSIALFYCIVFPVGTKYSIGKFLFKKSKSSIDTTYANICLKILQIHLCIAYFFSGLDKLIGFNWWNGESIWKALHMAYNPTLINVDVLVNTPIFTIVGWGTIIIEMLYPVFVNIKKTRKLWMLFVVMLHTFIAFFLGLYFFSTFMIILNVAAFYVPYLKEDDSIVSENAVNEKTEINSMDVVV